MWWAHVGWVLSTQFIGTRTENVKDLLKFKELRWLDTYHLIPPVLLVCGRRCQSKQRRC
jgi:stearoyl-CoA desaturase (delta-9 desaturase)